MSPQLFAILSSLIEERLGLHYGAEDADALAERLAPRIEEHGFGSLLDYYYFLRYDDASRRELDALADALVVNETYFFRETDALQVVVGLLEELGGHRRVWCAASSSGEEPYTLAMLLDGRGMLDRVELVASDISPRALARAREGLYRGRSLRALPDDMRLRYFDEEQGGVRLHPRVRSAVTFVQRNLVDDAALATLGSFDVIVCRNVLIYFRDERVRRVVERLTERLVLGGHLVVGASESLLRLGTSLTCVERGGAFLYRRDEP